MNERNARYVAVENPRRLYPLVDNKLRAKQLAEDAGIAVPRLLAVLTSQRDAWHFDESLDTDEGFVVKPATGSGGNGILVVTDSVGVHFRRSSGTLFTREALAHHAASVQSGMYSLGGQRDVAMVEERVQLDPLFTDLAWGGVPDIRVVVYRGVPVLAMLRLPTAGSDGKANLHLGGVGVGVDLARGVTVGGIRYDRPITHHPDTLAPITGIELPGWSQLLELVARCQALCGLGYLGVDVVLDHRHGPLVLELNARPGLSVQLANRIGLRPCLASIDRQAFLPEDAAGRAAFAREMFAGGMGRGE